MYSREVQQALMLQQRLVKRAKVEAMISLLLKVNIDRKSSQVPAYLYKTRYNHHLLNIRCISFHFVLWPFYNNEIGCSPNVVLYCALKPRLVILKLVVNLMVRNRVLSPVTIRVNPDLKPLSLRLLWPPISNSVNSTKSQL